MPKNQKTPADELVEEFIWCICYINKSYIDHAKSDLDKDSEFHNVEIFIPTVKILKKKFKGKPHYEKVPALFNYGFVKMPRYLALSSGYINKLKTHVSCIYGWVRDASAIIGEKPILSENNKETRIERCEYPTAIAYDHEMEEFIKTLENCSVYSKDDIDNLKKGTVVTLHGYPFDNISATILNVNKKKKEVKVSIDLFQTIKEVSVSFDNVFYTIYASQYSDEPIKEISLEELEGKYENSTLDTLFTKMNYFESPNY